MAEKRGYGYKERVTERGEAEQTGDREREKDNETEEELDKHKW